MAAAQYSGAIQEQHMRWGLEQGRARGGRWQAQCRFPKVIRFEHSRWLAHSAGRQQRRTGALL